MRGSALCLIIGLVQIFSHVKAEGKYTVIAPGTIHSHDKYTAAVSVHHVSEPCQIKVGITGPSFNESKVVEVTQNEVKNVEFDVPHLEGKDYNITAEGINCLGDFKNTTRLIHTKFNTYVRIQTDKGVYKPGDEINYRVVFLDKELRPAKPEKDSVIWIEDAKRNRIKEIKDFSVTKGVHTGKFQISEFPVMGGWRMGVSNGGRYDRTVYFDVEKYVLPKYVVKVEATKDVSVKDGDMQVVVRANYTYGKPLNGKVYVIVNLGYNHYREDENDKDVKQIPTIIKTAPMVQGKAKVDLNVKEYAAFLPYQTSSTYAPIIATVEEEFTGVKINGTTSTNIYPYRYAMHCHNDCYSFEADKERNITMQMSLVDGTHITDTKNPVEIKFTEVLRKHYWYRSPENEENSETEAVTTEAPETKNLEFTFIGTMNATGFVSFLVTLPDLPEHEGYSHFYKMECAYLDEKREISSAYQYRKPKKVEPEEVEEEPKEYFKLLGKWGSDINLKLNTEDKFTLNSSQPLSYFDYNVIGRGNILKSGRVELPDKPKVYNLTLTPEIMWAPGFRLYVYYVDDNGEYHYAEESYNVPYKLQNEITISAPEEVKPGEDVALKIKTSPNSFVALLAVDQSTLLLRRNNDLSAHEFNWVVSSYSTNTPSQGGYSYYPGQSSGCVTLTNADYFYNWTMPEYMLQRAFDSEEDESDSRSYYNHPILKSYHSETKVGLSAVPQSASGFSAGGYSGGGGGAIRVRKDFAETWLFADIENTETEEFTWSKKIPDTITSWVISAFSMNPIKGLGVTDEQTKITTFQPFFISIRLPYSVKRGEVINIPCLIFNYLNKDLDVTITLDNTDGEYDFTEVNNEVIGDQKRTKTVRVPAYSAAGASFLITPKTLGNVMLKFTAVSPVAGDAIHKSMKVVPEGITQYANRAYFVNLKDHPEEKSSFDLELPKDIVPDSQHVEVAVVGDIMGPVLRNPEQLVRLPMGCGEQTMSAMLPNYMVLKYLKNSNRLTPSLETKLLYNMERGYQHLLNYRHEDGSFSSFGPGRFRNKPLNGSTWLTAYVTRSLMQLKEYVNVDEKIVAAGLEYMIKQQAANGTFTEKGDYFYVSQANHISLTSSVLLALLEHPESATKYAKEIEKAADYIAQNGDEVKSLHSQAISTYALNKAKHSSAKEKLSTLKSLAKTDADRMWWSDDERKINPRWWFYVYSNDVETTSYALLSIIMDPSTKVEELYPIVRWMVAQRNSYGGFGSTQDTVVGLTALIEFAKKANYEPAKMDVEIISKGDGSEHKENIKLTEENGILYQNFEMPSKTKSIDYSVKGSGTALVQISYQYNIVDKNAKPSFIISTQNFDTKERPSFLSRMVCAKYNGEGKASNMAVLEINTPSGYVIEEDSLKAINDLERVSNTELKNSASMLVIYFDHLYKDQEVCLMLEAVRTHAVAMQKPAPMVLYDYYDPSQKVTEFYEVHSKLCDICEGEEECSKCK